MKRFYIHTLVCLLALCCCTTALAVDYNLRLGYDQTNIVVSDANCNDILGDGGSISYTPATKTLMFNNFSATGKWNFFISSFDAVRAIRLTGNNSLVGENNGGSIYLEVTCGETVTIYGDSPKDRLVCSHISMGRCWYGMPGDPPSYDVHLTIKDCTLKLYSDEKGLEGKDGRFTIENASVTVKSDDDCIVGWRRLVLGDGMSITQPFDASFSRKLGAVTADGKSPCKGTVSINPNGGELYQNAYVLYHKDGSVTGFSFSEKPVISYSGNELVVTTGSLTVQYPLDLLRKITVEGELVTADGLDEVTLPDTEFSFSDEGAKVRGEKPGTPFYVFDLKGSKVYQGVIDAEGKTSIPLHTLPQGIYVVKTQSTSFKVKR